VCNLALTDSSVEGGPDVGTAAGDAGAAGGSAGPAPASVGGTAAAGAGAGTAPEGVAASKGVAKACLQRYRVVGGWAGVGVGLCLRGSWHAEGADVLPLVGRCSCRGRDVLHFATPA